MSLRSSDDLIPFTGPPNSRTALASTLALYKTLFETAVTKAGKPCQAWAIVGSNPPLCSAHSGMDVGAGAPPGNQNAPRLPAAATSGAKFTQRPQRCRDPGLGTIPPAFPTMTTYACG